MMSMVGSLALELGDDRFELPGHELVVDEKGEPASLLVVAEGAGDELLVLLLDRDVVVDQHLHVQPVVPLLLQPSQGIRVIALTQPQLYIPLDFLHEDPGLAHLLQRLLVLLHLTENGRLVEVGWYDVVLVLVLEVLDQRLLKVDREAHRLQGHHEVAALLQDAGQVVESQDLELAQCMRIGDVLGHLRKHHHIYSFGDELDVATLLLLDVLHRQPVDLLHEAPHLRSQLETQLHLLPLQHHESQVDQFLLTEDALDGVALPALPELANHGPDVEQDLLVADAAVLDELDLLSFYGNHDYREQNQLSRACCGTTRTPASCPRGQSSPNASCIASTGCAAPAITTPLCALLSQPLQAGRAASPGSPSALSPEAACSASWRSWGAGCFWGGRWSSVRSWCSCCIVCR